MVDRGDTMHIQLHDQFQAFLDQTIDSSLSMKDMKERIKKHLLERQNEYENMLLAFFKDEILTNDTYFYITYTYHDYPIDLNKEKEIVVSFLYDIEKGMHYELVVFNENKIGTETKEIFSRCTNFYS